MARRQPLNILLTVLSWLALGLAAITLTPFPASHPNLIGYRSVCAFVPVSSLILLGLSGFFRVYRDSLSRPAKSARSPNTR